MKSKRHWVRIENDESIPYIENHFKIAEVKLIRVKGENFDMILKYDEVNENKVSEEIKQLTDKKIIAIDL